MSAAPHRSETIHASCVAIKGRAVLITGPSGAGKSDLALRLIDRGARLVSDDYTVITPSAGADAPLTSAPPTIAGKMELRGIGILDMPCVTHVPAALVVSLSAVVERMPTERLTIPVAGVDLPVMRLSPFEASAPIKVEMMLRTLSEGASS